MVAANELLYVFNFVRFTAFSRFSVMAGPVDDGETHTPVHHYCHTRRLTI